MTFATAQLVIDFGLVVLIWIIQRLVYPSFSYYSKEALVIWHQKYTARIGSIVGPLMLAQLAMAVYALFNEITISHITTLLIIGFLWLSTAMQFVPIHQNISKGRIDDGLLAALVRKNWIRTLAWTFLFGFHLVLIMFHLN